MTNSDIISIVGAILSLIALLFTIYELIALRRTTRDYHEQVTREVRDAQQKIKSGLTISALALTIKQIEEAIKYIQSGHYELASLRMEDIEPVLEEISQNEGTLSPSDKLYFIRHLSDFRDSMRSLLKNHATPELLVPDNILVILSVIRTDVIKISNSLKNSLYGE